jgi:type II secretory pathway pseudopilin PulG
MKKGFTLTESLIVGLILVLIGGVSYINFRYADMKSRDQRRKGDLQALSEALDKYYSDYEEYPAMSDENKLKGCGAPKYVDICEWGLAQWGDIDGTIYMARLPSDPVPTRSQYIYKTNHDKSIYWIYTSLENKNDESLKSDVTERCPGVEDVNTKCNYFISKDRGRVGL